jgi:glycerol kinase
VKYILSIDQGTTGTTAALVDLETLQITKKTNQEFEQIFPKPGQVEHNLNDIWATVETTVKQVVSDSGARFDQIQGIGITNQRETICAFKKDGSPLCNAIVWQDRRTQDFCKSASKDQKEMIQQKTGLTLDPYFSGTKIKWLIENNTEVKKALAEDNCLFGTIDTYLLYRLSSGKAYATEPSNASRTLLFNIQESCWDEELLQLFNVTKSSLPTVKSSFGEFGKTEGLGFLPDGIKISGILGDQQAALFGQAGFQKGMSKCTYGTGAFYLINTGKELKRSSHGLLTTIAYQENGINYYALEGSSYIAGAAVQWLRDNLKIIKESSEIEALALEASSSSMENILFLPFFTGIGSPHWISDAQAAIVGITRDTGNAQIAKACLEGICLSINDLIQSVEKDFGEELKELRVDGGAVVNDLLMRTQSSFSNLTIIRPEVIETTAFGAACAAAIGAGLMTKEDISQNWRSEKVFKEERSSYHIEKKKKWDRYISKSFL